MINIIILNSLLIAAGYLLAKAIIKNHTNPIIVLGISFGLGVGLNAILFFFYSAISNERIGFWHILIWLSAVIIGLAIYLYKKRILFRPEIGFTKNILKVKYHPFEFLLIFIIFSLVLSLFYNSLIFPFGNADEWSYWGTAAKRIFQFGSIDLRGMGFGGFEKYPLLIPITSASVNMFVGTFYENFSRVVTPLFTLFMMIFLVGFLKEFSFKKKEIYCFVFLLLTAGNIYSAMAATLYADVQLGYLYSVAVMLFLLSIKKPEVKKGLYFLSGAFFSFAAFTKIEALYICLASVFGLMFLDWLYHKNNLKDYLYFLLPSFFLPVSWFFYSKAKNLGAAGWTEGIFANTEYAFKNFFVIIKNMAKKTINPYYYTTFWVYVVLSSVIGFFTSLKNKYFIFIFAIIFGNFLYLLSTYLFVFNAPTIAVLASFERYIIHFLPLSLLMVAFVYQDTSLRLERKNG